MAEEDEPTFETADAGSSHVYPQAAGDLRKGSYVMIKGHPCKVTDLSFSKTGKHGHAKAHIVANDIFTGKKCEDLCPSSHNMEIPFVKRTEFQILSADADTGEITLLTESGETKEDLFLPDQVKVGEPTDEDKKLTKQICETMEKGEKNLMAIVQSACGMEKIIDCKEVA